MHVELFTILINKNHIVLYIILLAFQGWQMEDNEQQASRLESFLVGMRTIDYNFLFFLLFLLFLV